MDGWVDHKRADTGTGTSERERVTVTVTMTGPVAGRMGMWM